MLARDRKWLQVLNCIQAKAGLKVTVIERNSLGWQVRVNAADNSIKLPQTEHTAPHWRGRVDGEGRRRSRARTNLREANKSSGRPARASRNPATPIDQCCVHQAAQEAPLATCCSGQVGWNFGQLTDHISIPKVAR